MKIHIFLLTLLLIPMVFGFGVSPVSMNLVDPMDHVYQLRIINQQNEDITLSLTPTGAAKNFIELRTQEVHLQPGIPEVRIPVTISVPSSALPGTYVGGIDVEQKVSQTGDVISAIPAVRHKVTVTVPSAGKFVDAHMQASASAASEPATLTVVVKNVGTENISFLTSRVDIRSATNTLISSLSSEQISLDAGQTKNIVFDWTAPSTGPYSARAVINYDGLSTTADAVFEVGDLNVRLAEMQFGAFSLGDVVRIDLPVTSEWNNPLSGVYASYKIISSDMIVDTFTGASTDLAPLGDGVLTGYWNTAGRAPGTYTVEATAFFGGKQKRSSTDIVVGLDGATSAKQTNNLFWLEVALIILILGIIIAFAVKKFINNQS